ncbi:hypothetical protein C8Q77DRAFT_1054055 [Trametes polyzona]|nr:hypothetical protein C8Q77DRAFT_1054055 [Trametes polyzona]
MKLVVRVQYIGDRARMLLREDQAGEYTKGLIDDLTTFGFPMPHEQKPIEKSGFMLCVYHVDRDSEMHRIIQNAFQKARAEAAYLVDRSIRYISLNEDGVMHTTNLSQKPYKTKLYNNKPEYQSAQPYPSSSYKQQYGKAPKYPSTISQARHAVSPLAQRMAGDPPGPSGHPSDYGDHEMTYARSPQAGSDEGPPIDTTQQTLLQLSQSSAFQSLLQKATPVAVGSSVLRNNRHLSVSSLQPPPVKSEPAPSTDLSMLLRQPPTSTTSQPQIPNLQELLEKAGVRSSTAHAFLQTSQSQYHPSSSNLAIGPSSSMASSSSATPMLSSLVSPSTSHSAPSQAVGLASTSTSASTGAAIARPATTTPRVPTLRELWDIRREITALQARGRNVAADLRAAGQQIPLGPEDATPPSMTGGNGGGADLLKMRELEAEIIALRQQLSQEAEARRLAEATLRAERALRTDVDTVKRECQDPFVVPSLVDAFMKIGQIAGDGLQDPSPAGRSMPMEL